MTQRCKSGFAVGGPTGPRVYAGGVLVADDDPILSTHKDFFEPVEAQVARQDAAPRSVSAVEAATAVPGELRETNVRARKGVAR